MKVTDLPYYAKFIFSSSDGDCSSTADHSLFQFIKNAASQEPIHSIRVGDVIFFEPNDKRYKVENIIIRHLVEDTDHNRYGFDSSDCTETQGEHKEILFSVLVEMEPA